jgi:hypothetical protein
MFLLLVYIGAADGRMMLDERVFHRCEKAARQQGGLFLWEAVPTEAKPSELSDTESIGGSGWCQEIPAGNRNSLMPQGLALFCGKSWVF